MAAAESWGVDALSRSGDIVVEILTGADGRVLSIDAPHWSLSFRLFQRGLVHVIWFVRKYGGRAEFAECVIGEFRGVPVRLVNDGEFPDRMWLRINEAGCVAEFSLIGDHARSFIAAVTEVADTELKHEHWRSVGGGQRRLTHLPTGISVSRDHSALPIRQIHEELIADLAQKLADQYADQRSSARTIDVDGTHST